MWNQLPGNEVVAEPVLQAAEMTHTTRSWNIPHNLIQGLENYFEASKALAKDRSFHLKNKSLQYRACVSF